MRRLRAVIKKLRAYLDTEHPQFLERVLLAHLVVVLWALLFAAVIGGCSKDASATMGQIGDVLGGVSNFVVSFVVVLSAAYATRQFQKFREQHTHEVRAEVAFSVWRATQNYAIHYGALSDLASLDGIFKAEDKAINDAFWAGWGDAHLALRHDENLLEALTYFQDVPQLYRERTKILQSGDERAAEAAKAELVALRRWLLSLLDHLRLQLATYLD